MAASRHGRAAYITAVRTGAPPTDSQRAAQRDYIAARRRRYNRKCPHGTGWPAAGALIPTRLPGRPA